MKTHTNCIIKKIVSVFLLACALLSAMALASCGKDSSDNGKRKGLHDIPQEDKAAYTSVLDRYMEYMNGDYEALRDIYPNDYWENVGSTVDEIIALYEKSREDTEKTVKQKYGDDVVVSYRIYNEKDYSDFLEEFKTSVKNNQNIEPERITKAYYLNLTITIKGSASESSVDTVFIATKIDNSWYLINEEGGFNGGFN